MYQEVSKTETKNFKINLNNFTGPTGHAHQYARDNGYKTTQGIFVVIIKLPLTFVEQIQQLHAGFSHRLF